MAKNNWKHGRDNLGNKMWKSKGNKLMIFIIPTHRFEKGYNVDIMTTKKLFESTFFNKRIDAENYAHNYMKRFPHG